MRVLVTGGAGYIGSVVAAMLLEAGHEVTALDDLSTGHADAVPPGAEFVKASITDAGSVLAERRYDAVLHFAARSLVGESVDHPDRYWHNNVGGTLALLDAMRANDVPRLVFSSTAATYGEPTQVPIVEDAPAAPTNPYGASKLAVDLALTDYARAYGLAAVSLRYFNVAGALLRPDGGHAFGERHAVETHLIPIALQVAAGTRPALDVYGSDYPTADGTCIRDYVHVVDLGDAHLRAMAAATAGQHRVVNLGSGSGYSVREVVEAVRRVTGRDVPTREAARRPGDPAVLVASNARAASELGWRPERDLDRMVADAWGFATR
ncbi:MAG TPA: UDP-glucose 4-epimerase GalE [Jatrophihabitantaceae bacterium]|jgi:UDP-glucose 4-epimerase